MDFRQHGAGRPQIQANGVRPNLTAKTLSTTDGHEFTRIETAKYTDHTKGRARHFRRRLAMAGQAVRAAPAPDFTAS
jgi:hypothetical protein